MHINRSSLLYASIVTVAVIAGCKKSSSSDVVTDPVCTPVTFASAPSSDVYIVTLDNGDSKRVATAYEVRIQSADLLQRHNINLSQLRTVVNNIDGGFIASLSSEQAAELRNDTEVKIIEKDRVYALTVDCFTVEKPSSAPWGVRRVGADDGTGKRVWIIDTGVDTDHPDLIVDKTLSKSFIDGDTSPEDNNGHGTHVAGIIGAVNNSIGVLGVASGTTIIALKALNSVGEGSTSTLIKALNYVGQNAKAGEVVNMSLGADTISASLDNAVRTLAEKGILFAIAAGNDAKSANLCSPARVNNANVYTVTAIDSAGVFARFSNFGNDVVDYAAPGVSILSTYTEGRYARISGTSMAAPHVAGILVVMGNKIKSKGVAASDPDGVADPIASY